MDLRYTLRYLGVPIKSKSFRFVNNRSVVTSAILPHSSLSKRHNILAFHRVREAIAANIVDFHWIQFEYNLSDMLSKHWEHIKIFPMIQKLLITCGPIILIPRSATKETPKSSSLIGSSTQCSRFPSSIHVPTYYTSIHHACQLKNMPHPPEEGSNRSLPHGTLLEVSWQMCHA